MRPSDSTQTSRLHFAGGWLAPQPSLKVPIGRERMKILFFRPYPVTPLGTYGNTGRNIIRLPGVNNWDMSLFKNANLTEKVRMQFRVELFNAWNHTQYGAPVLNVQSATFGQILSANAPRLIQFAVKFLW